MVVHAYDPSYLGGWGRRVAWTQEVEVAVSWGHATILQHEQQNETLSQKTKQNKTFLDVPPMLLWYAIAWAVCITIPSCKGDSLFLFGHWIILFFIDVFVYLIIILNKTCIYLQESF